MSTAVKRNKQEGEMVNKNVIIYNYNRKVTVD